MQPNILTIILAAAYKMEIANPVKYIGENSLLVDLPNASQVLITARPLRNDPCFRPTTHPERHSYHYTANPDPDEKLQLLSLEDCRCYIDDVCQNLLDAEYRDGELTFPNGDVYLLTLMTYE